MQFHIFLQLVKLILGAFIAASPWLFGYADNRLGVGSHVVVGVLLVGMAVVNLVKLVRHQPLVGERH